MASKKNLLNECVAEFSGAGLFVVLGAGSIAGLQLAGASYTYWDISIVWGIGIALAIYVTAGVTGAHLNPAVTLAFAVFGNFDKQKIIPYILAQIAGGFAAAAVVYFLYFDLFATKDMATAAVLTTFPKAEISLLRAFMNEFFMSTLLISLIFSLSDDGNGLPRGALTPLLVGFAVAAISAAFGPLTGPAISPARDFGPRLFVWLAGWEGDVMGGGRAVPYVFIPMIAPLLGGLAGAALYIKLIGEPLKRRQAAQQADLPVQEAKGAETEYF
ncbi:MAG: Glycerol uptake facilitator protein [Candidatus Tokpelaia hoelldobleri]|uniref:Glycerol uptake facilitator protein n=1 Tax=Candidatus Tokpelaia hoelldobleri TaxID=1902579 RepID=A0A1U9JW85_9HYPH|nr:MAG: Glycerol uptake facilitator protein [Candidatus Tokpelaia hoelldoblerii]